MIRPTSPIRHRLSAVWDRALVQQSVEEDGQCLCSVLHQLAEAQPLPSRAVEKRERGPGGIGLQFGE